MKIGSMFKPGDLLRVRNNWNFNEPPRVGVVLDSVGNRKYNDLYTVLLDTGEVVQRADYEMEGL